MVDTELLPLIRAERGKIAYARALRKRHTPAERLFWNAVRNRACAGIKFRRQTAIGAFIADFCSLEDRLIVELDGEIHENNQEYDVERERVLRGRGFHILRFTNRQVTEDLPGTLATIARVVGSLRAGR